MIGIGTGINFNIIGSKSTIYFDSNNESSLGRGTYKHPYNTLPQIINLCQGDMRGKTLAIKRNLHVRGTFYTRCNGTASAPFKITTYGDGEKPIFNAGVVLNNWTNYASDNRIWQHTNISRVVDVYTKNSEDDYSRLWAVTGANLTEKITAIQNYISNPMADTVGCYAYDGTTIYALFRDESNPNLEQVEIASGDMSICVYHTDNDNAGNISISSIKGIMARNIAIGAFPQTFSETHAPKNIEITDCEAKYAGCQIDAASLSGAGISLSGINDSLRLTKSYFARNYSKDVLNNAIEFVYADNNLVDHGLSEDVGGCSIAELWAGCSNNTVQFCKGYENHLAKDRVVDNYHRSGIWFNNLYTSVLADNAKNTGNIARFNYAQDMSGYGADIQGQNQKIYNNTFVDTRGLCVALRFDGGDTATGTSAKNNLVVYNTGNSSFKAYPVKIGRTDFATANMTLDYNGYYNLSRHDYSSSMEWADNVVGLRGYFDGWQSAGRDTHGKSTFSNADYNYQTSQCDSSLLQFQAEEDGSFYSLGATSRAVGSGVSIDDEITTDINGNIIPSSPNIGCLQTHR